jgi:uncharacterized membrane protein
MSAVPPEGGVPPPPPVGGDSRTLNLFLCYLGPLAFITYATEKSDAEVKWHARHGIVLFVLSVVVFVGLHIVGAIVPLLWLLTAPLSLLWGLLVFVVWVLCLVKALAGQRFLIPGVSSYADRF